MLQLQLRCTSLVVWDLRLRKKSKITVHDNTLLPVTRINGHPSFLHGLFFADPQQNEGLLNKRTQFLWSQTRWLVTNQVVGHKPGGWSQVFKFFCDHQSFKQHSKFISSLVLSSDQLVNYTYSRSQLNKFQFPKF